MLVEKFKKMETINKNVFEDLTVNLGLTEEEIIILYVVSCRLQEIDCSCPNSPISNSEYSFEHNGNKIVNIFDWSNNPEKILPTYYYKLRTRKNFNLLNLIKSSIRQYDDFDGSVEDIEYIIDTVLNYIIKVLKLDYNITKKHIFLYDYLCSSVDSLNLEIRTTEDEELTSEKKRELVLYLINDYKHYTLRDITFLKSYFIYKYDFEIDKLRVSILEFLHWNDKNGTYLDKETFSEEYIKYSFSDALVLLLSELCIGLGLNCINYEDIKLELVKNPRLKSLYFNSLEILLNEPNVEGFKKIIDLI